MDKRYFINKEVAEEEFAGVAELLRETQEEVSKDPGNERSIRKQKAEGCKAAANDQGEKMRLAINTMHRVYHNKSSERANNTRALSSLSMLCATLLVRQGADILRGI